jgi:hypothetical protein
MQYKHNIQSIIDIPCGDFNYFKLINLDNINYKGFDISENAILLCKKYENENISFGVLDATCQKLPYADLIICKDLFIHLSFKDIFSILENIKNNCRYFGVSRYDNGIEKNIDKESGLSARPIDISQPPFSFSKKIVKKIKCTNNSLRLDEIIIYDLNG